MTSITVATIVMSFLVLSGLILGILTLDLIVFRPKREAKNILQNLRAVGFSDDEIRGAVKESEVLTKLDHVTILNFMDKS